MQFTDALLRGCESSPGFKNGSAETGVSNQKCVSGGDASDEIPQGTVAEPVGSIGPVSIVGQPVTNSCLFVPPTMSRIKNQQVIIGGYFLSQLIQGNDDVSAGRILKVYDILLTERVLIS